MAAELAKVFEVSCVLIACIMASFIMLDGSSHWMQGAILLVTYAVMATGFGLHKGKDDGVEI